MRARWVLPVLAIPPLALLGYGLTRDVQTLPSAHLTRPAPQFRLATMAGAVDGTVDSLALADFRGRVVLLNFWASWCAPCQVEHPVLLRAHETYDPRDVVLLGVLFDDSAENGRDFMRRFGGDWPSVLDPGLKTAIEYGVYGVPETFFIGADGLVAHRQAGTVSWPLVTGIVDSLLAARGPRPDPPTETLADPGDTEPPMDPSGPAEEDDTS